MIRDGGEIRKEKLAKTREQQNLDKIEARKKQKEQRELEENIHKQPNYKKPITEEDEFDFLEERRQSKKKRELTLEERLRYRHHRLEVVNIINQDKIHAKLFDLYDPKHACKFETLTAYDEEHIFNKLERLFGLIKEDLFIERSEKEVEEVTEVIKERVQESKTVSLFKKLCTYIDKYNVKMKFTIKKVTDEDITIILFKQNEEDSIDYIHYNGRTYHYFHEGKSILDRKVLEDIFI